MGIFESLLEAIQDMQKEIESLNYKIKEIHINQNQEEIWRRKELEEFTGFKYATITRIINKTDFPKFYIGQTPCFLKSEVIKYFMRKQESKENKQKLLNNKSSISSLYTIR